LGNDQTDAVPKDQSEGLDARVPEAWAGRKVMLKTAGATLKEHSTAGLAGDMLDKDEAVQGHMGSCQYLRMVRRKGSVPKVRYMAIVVGQPWDRERHIVRLSRLLKRLVEPAS
jgi:hypothetical protein